MDINIDTNFIFLIIFLVVAFYLFIKKDRPINIEGLQTFNGRMAIDDQWYHDKLFDDVAYYPNEYEEDYERGEEIGKLLKTGWMRCKEECPGHCVEFGVTGHSHCFPY